MTRLRPRSLKGRTTLVVAVVVLSSHLLGLALYIAYNAEDLSRAREQHVAERLVTVTRLLERLPPERRAAASRDISDANLQLSVDGHPKVDKADGLARDTRALRQLLGLAIGDALHEEVLADYREIAGDSLELVRSQSLPDREIFAERVADLFRFQEDLLLSVRLSDGRWLNALVVGNPFMNFLNPGLPPSVLLMGLVALMLSAWAVNRPLSALAEFTRAAEALGVNLSQPAPLTEHGPLEIRRTIRAFNRMQRRIQSLVTDRTRMVAAMSHDLRTPLTRMRLRLEAVQDDSARERMLRDIDDMDAMISATLRFATEATAEEPRQPIDLVRLVGDLAEDMGLDPPATDGVCELRCQGDPTSLRRALSNLVTNALAYGGEARLSLERRDDEALLLVDDRGPGIPPEERENVFEPFYRLEPSRNRHTGGTGLGLSIARAVLRSHGGDITISRSPEGGARLRLCLPLVPDGQNPQ